MAQAVEAPPPTPVEPVTEILHGIEITDPYRWLEDQNSPRTRKWLEEQAAYTRAYFDAIPDREQIRTRVRELLALKEVISEPWNVGDRYFFLKRQEDREQPVIVMRDGLFGAGNCSGRPRTAWKAGTQPLSLSLRSLRMVASWRTRCDKEGLITRLSKSSTSSGACASGSSSGRLLHGFVFAPDGTGFYYSHRELHDPHPNYRAAFWHRFGTERSQDREVFFAGEEPNLFLGILDSPEAKLLAYAVFLTGKSPRTSVYLQEMSSKRASGQSCSRGNRRLLRTVFRAWSIAGLHRLRSSELSHRSDRLSSS